MRALVRKHLLSITPYSAGKPIEETRRQLGLRRVIKLASNENPLGPSPKAVAAIKKQLSQLNRYPDSNGYSLKLRLAKGIGVEPSSIVLGNGSDELIDIIIKTFVEEDESLLTAETTFLEYRIIGQVNRRRVIEVPLKYFTYDLAAIKKRVDEKTKLIFIANPNNPTGTYVNRDEFNEFLKGLPRHVLVVLDEAYDTFIDVDDFPHGCSYLKGGRVIVLKTFSKAYGLAGLRIGYAVAPQELARYMEVCRQPFNTNLLAQAAARAALDDARFCRRTRQVVLTGKRYLYDALKAMGLPYVPSVANFILVETGRDGRVLFREMLTHGVIVRDMHQYGLKNFIRVTIGTPVENEKFIKALRKVLGRGGQR